MEKVEIKYYQLLFLYAYLRLIDLSLDRSRWNLWGEFQSYFKNIISPYQVIQYVKNSFHIPETDLEHLVLFLEKKTIMDRLKSSVFKSLRLRQDEILYCCKLLSGFEKVLNSDDKNYNLEIENLRIEIAKYYTEVLGPKILNKDLNKLMKIEHFGQNDEVEVIELNKFIPNDFSL